MKRTFHSLAKQDRPAFGIYIGDTGACIAEMAAFAGFDYMRIDCEHTLVHAGQLRELIRIADANDLPSLVRISCLDDITKLLDFGASAVLVPDISTADQAREAVRRCKYAPVGERGMTNISRCVRYGEIPLKEYHARANQEVCLAVQIESVEALHNIDEILAVEGIDIVTTGLQDLSQSMNLPGQSSHPSVVEAQDMVIRKTVERGLYPLITAGTPEQSRKLLDAGVVLQTVCFDTAFIMKSFQQMLASYRG